MQEFVGKAAFVTGGASGIGLALGRAFAEAGRKARWPIVCGKALPPLPAISFCGLGGVLSVLRMASLRRTACSDQGLAFRSDSGACSRYYGS